jgi:hypothetical protein
VHYDFVIWPDRTRKIPISNDYTSRDGISRKFEIFLREIISPASLVGIEHESDYRRDFNLKRWFLDLFLPSFYQTAKAGLWLVSAAIFFSFGLYSRHDPHRWTLECLAAYRDRLHGSRLLVYWKVQRSVHELI